MNSFTLVALSFFSPSMYALEGIILASLIRLCPIRSDTFLYMYISTELPTWSWTWVAVKVSWHKHVQFGAVVHGFFYPHLFGTFGGMKRCCKWNGGWCVCYNRCIIWVLDDIYFSTWASGETDHHIRIGTYICLDVGSNNSFLGHHIVFYRCKFPHFLNISW